MSFAAVVIITYYLDFSVLLECSVPGSLDTKRWLLWGAFCVPIGISVLVTSTATSLGYIKQKKKKTK